MKTRIYILGETRGAVRSQNFIKLLTDHWNEYKVYYENIFYSNRFLRYLKSLLINPFIIIRSQVVYICTLNVDINIFWELCLAWLFRKKIVVDYYVSVYDTVVLDRKWFNEKSVLAKLAHFFDRFFLRVGTKIIFLNQTERERYCRIADVWPAEERIQIIPLCNEISFPLDSPFIYGTRNSLTVCWWGSYLPLHGLDVIIHAAKIIQMRRLPVSFYLFGNSDTKGRPYEQMVKELDLSDMCVLRNDFTFNNGKLSAFLKEKCDVALGVFGGTDKAANVITNKLLNACALQVLVITGESPAVREYFDPEDSLLMCGHHAEGLADTIERLFYMNKQELLQRTVKTKEIYQANFTVDCFRKRMLDMLASL